MTKKKQETALGLPPLPPPPIFAVNSSGGLFRDTNTLSTAELQIVERLHEQELVMDGTAEKTIFGIDKMNEVKVFGTSDFLYTAQSIDESKQEAQGASYQAAVDEFSEYVTKLAGRHILGAIEVCSNQIAQEIQRSLYPPPPEKPEKRSLGERLRILFGG